MPGEFYVEGKKEKVNLTEIRNVLTWMQSMADFWSEPVEEVQINAAGITVTLPSVAIEGIPDRASVVRAIAMFKFRMVENTDTGANKLNGGTVPATSQVIQVRDSTPSPWTDAINFADDQFGLEGQTREGVTSA